MPSAVKFRKGKVARRTRISFLFAFLILTLVGCLSDSFSLDLGSANIPTATVSALGATNLRALDLNLSSDKGTEVGILIDAPCSYESVPSWRSFGPTLTVTLPDQDGPHSISVIIRTADHFASACQKISVLLDRQGPAAPAVISPVNTVADLTTVPAFSFSAAVDTFSTVMKHQVRLMDETSNLAIYGWVDIANPTPPALNTIPMQNLIEGRSYHLEVRGIDSLGNVGAARSSASFYSGPFVTIADTTLTAYGVLQVGVQLDYPAPVDVVVNYSTASGTAIDNLDYTVDHGQVLIAKGSMGGQILVNARNYYKEGPARYFNLVHTATGAVAGSAAKVTLPLVGTDTDLVSLSSGQNAVSVGVNDACTLNSAGEVRCWGAGVGTGSNKPGVYNHGIKVPNLPSPATQVSSGASTVCALLQNKTIYCWGSNANLPAITATPSSLGLANVAYVSVSPSDSICVVDIYGAVLCAGDNIYGELGDGTHTSRATFVAATSLNGTFVNPGNPKVAVKVLVGVEFACAQLTSGSLYCWGTNYSSQLGPTPSLTPSLIAGISPIIDFSISGAASACVVDMLHRAFCWGSNLNGVLGLPPTTTQQSTSPVQVTALGAVNKITLDDAHGCAIQQTGNLVCWGGNPHGELGYPYWGTYLTPVVPTGLTGTILDVSASNFTNCAVNALGEVWCWGWQNIGLTGLPQKAYPTGYPIPVNSLFLGPTIKEISTSESTFCQRDNADIFWCSASGMGGISTQNDLLMNEINALYATPVSIQPMIGFAASSSTQCGILKADQSVVCRGKNDVGQLGDGTGQYIDSTTWVPVQNLLPNTVSIAASESGFCAVSASGVVQCWGHFSNSVGGSSLPTNISGLPSSAKIFGGFLTRAWCALSKAQEVWCWGNTTQGALGNGVDNYTDQIAPTKIIGLSGVVEVSLTYNGGCAVTAMGAGYCWGDDGSKRVGDQGTSDVLTPFQIPLSNVKSIATGTFGTCAALANGTVWCWGDNDNGILGQNNAVSSPTPVQVLYIAGNAIKVVMIQDENTIAQYLNSVCALIQMPGGGQDVKCWGGSSPYFGRGTYVAPRQIPFFN